MFDLLWKEFVDAKIAAEYYFFYIHHSRRRIGAINAIGLILSLTGVVSFVADFLPPLLASLIVLVGQVISVLQPLYPFGDRLYAAKLIHAAYSQPILFAEQTINLYLYGPLSDEDLSANLKSIQESLSTIEAKFASADLFPPKKRLHKKAEKNVSQYLKVHYNSGG